MTTVIALGSMVCLKRDKQKVGKVVDIYNRGSLANYVTVECSDGQYATIRETNWMKKK